MRVLLLLAVLFCASCSSRQTQRTGLVVTHRPNPSDVHHSAAFEQPPFPFMWYYRTEVKNTTNKPLRIVWFESYSEAAPGQWQPGNVLNRTLTGADFADWYTEGVACPQGVIPPGGIAACDPNWHGSHEPHFPRVRWAYKATDSDGREYSAEAIADSVPIPRSR